MQQSGAYMRLIFSVIFILMIVSLIWCGHIAWHSRKKVGPSLGQLLYALVPPIFGNLILICSSNEMLSKAGCYIYFLGMDYAVVALLCFAVNYCEYRKPGKSVIIPVSALVVIDCIQLLLNPFFGQAFDIEPVAFGGSTYYKVIPFLGQTYHRVVCYGIFFSVLVMFVIKVMHSPRIYVERYFVILLSMILTGLWETFYIFSRTPIDRSMIGFGVFGLLVFYFSLYYKYTRLLDNILANMASSMKEAVFIFNAEGTCIWANDPATELTGIGKDNYEQAGERVGQIFGNYTGTGSSWRSKRVVSMQGQERYYILEEQDVLDSRGNYTGMFLSVRDNTQEQMELNREKYNAAHDALTDLYTKDHLYEQIRSCLDLNPDISWYIVFIDVMNFKLINDIFGNSFGDRTIRMIADRIREYAGERCIYGYLGADHFGMLIPESEYDEETLKKMMGRFPLTDGTTEFEVMIHAGVNEVVDPSIEIPVLFDWARMAMESIHRDFSTIVAYYSDEMREKAVWDQYISSRLSRAIEEKQLQMYVQPIVDMSGHAAGGEALARWIHPEHGFLLPSAFIPVFEKNGRIADVDRYIWRCACETLSRWKAEGRDEFLSVNISPNDFYFLDVGEEIRSLVKEYDIDPQKLRLEITETAMMEDQDNRISKLLSLKEDGFLIEMDDFGSGYSSFNMLKEMPVDIIKIDMRFLKKKGDSRKADVIIRNIVRMSDELGIISLTEGVETREQFEMLTGIGCRLCQGFYFSKPLPVEEFEKRWLER